MGAKRAVSPSGKLRVTLTLYSASAAISSRLPHVIRLPRFHRGRYAHAETRPMAEFALW